MMFKDCMETIIVIIYVYMNRDRNIKVYEKQTLCHPLFDEFAVLNLVTCTLSSIFKVYVKCLLFFFFYKNGTCM